MRGTRLRPNSNVITIVKIALALTILFIEFIFLSILPDICYGGFISPLVVPRLVFPLSA